MLINSHAGSRRSVAFELIISAALVFGVGAAVYQVQHPHQDQTQRIEAAFQQQ